jgi:hypothetical protein
MRIILAFVMAASVALGQRDKPRVFITDSTSWELSGGLAGGASGGSGGVAGTASGGARPQTAEIMKTFGERCPRITVTINRERADYIVILEHEGGKDSFQKDNKVVVFDKDGDMIYSGSTRTLGNAVKDACGAVSR